MELSVKLQVFEGPLDLLLHLIDKNQIDIYDIPIVDITEQYMAYLDKMRKADLNIMSEFLVMAATLLDIKSKMLLPSEKTEDTEEEQVDPRAELVAKLLEYKLYKSISAELKDREFDSEMVYFRKPSIPDEVAEYRPPLDLDELIGDVDLNKLNEIFKSLMKKQDDLVDPIRSKFGKIEKEEISVEDKMGDLRKLATDKKSFSFREVLSRSRSKLEVIVTFLAILELMKTGEVTISQEKRFDDIEIASNIAA